MFFFGDFLVIVFEDVEDGIMDVVFNLIGDDLNMFLVFVDLFDRNVFDINMMEFVRKVELDEKFFLILCV